MLIHSELVSVESVKSIASPEPHEPIVILDDWPYRGVGKTVLDGEVLKLNRFNLGTQVSNESSHGERGRGENTEKSPASLCSIRAHGFCLSRFIFFNNE